MSFFNDTNTNRVTKIVDTIELISKSSISNKASSDDLWKLMDPAIVKMSAVLTSQIHTLNAHDTPEPTSAPEPSPSKPTASLSRWHQIQELLRDSSLEELGMALTAISCRVDELGFDIQKGRSTKVRSD